MPNGIEDEPETMLVIVAVTVLETERELLVEREVAKSVFPEMEEVMEETLEI